ncbi:MAG: DUF2076 domain-containing protein [Lautropia sp.]
MNLQERRVIDDLFDKLAQAERQAGPREPEAEGHIRSRIQAQPGAPYLMAQTIVMQTHALEAAQARLAALEAELAQRPAGGGFLSGLFGGGTGTGTGTSKATGARESTATSSALRDAGFGSSPPGQTNAQAQRGTAGGGFLAGAAQTAMGVAGGMLLGSMIGSAFGGGGAHETSEPKSSPDVADADPTDVDPADVDLADDDGGDVGIDEA